MSASRRNRRRDSSAAQAFGEEIVAVLVLVDAKVRERLITAFHTAGPDEPQKPAQDLVGLPHAGDAEIVAARGAVVASQKCCK